MNEQIPEETTQPAAKAATKRPSRWVVMHVGLNRHDRRQFGRTARLRRHRDAKAGVEARRMLAKTPDNYPVRKVQIDDRTTYVFEPFYQAGMRAYNAEYDRQLRSIPGPEGTPIETLQKFYADAFVAASRAFVAKVAELGKAASQAPETANV